MEQITQRPTDIQILEQYGAARAKVDALYAKSYLNYTQVNELREKLYTQLKHHLSV